ncbi:MAG: gliding motility lipoprotein GldD [Chitinophagales bacterium]
MKAHFSLPTSLLLFASIFCATLLQSCGEEDYIPKPKAYFRIILPEHNYQSYVSEDCPFAFEQATYAKVAKNRSAGANPCWIDIDYPDLNAKIHLSYKEVGGKSDNLPKLINDAYKLNSKHVRKADYIEEVPIRNEQGVLGLWYKVGGDAASSTQLYLTDSLNHFIWASLYFSSTPNEDSIAPVVKFIRKDLDRFVESFEWKREVGSRKSD